MRRRFFSLFACSSKRENDASTLIVRIRRVEPSSVRMRMRVSASGALSSAALRVSGGASVSSPNSSGTPCARSSASKSLSLA